jgi:hypothetical protein
MQADPDYGQLLDEVVRAQRLAHSQVAFLCLGSRQSGKILYGAHVLRRLVVCASRLRDFPVA